ncbi:MAG: YtxH domain-containing protein [Gemmatimonadaceae bacterium]
MSLLGVGMIVGTVIGAGVALLLAPDSGYQTRRSIKRRVGGIRPGRGVWARLGKELRRAAAAKRKSLEMEARRNEVLLHKAKVGNS